MSPVAPRSRPPKRPWYLVAALVAGWLLGANAMGDGCGAVQVYRAETIRVEAPQQITDDQTRKELADAMERKFAVMDAVRNRLLPISVALLVLGAAMVMLSARAMSGRPGARGALVQVTLVRAAVMIGGFFAVPELRAQEAVINERAMVAFLHEQPKRADTKEAMESLERRSHALARAVPVAQLVGGALVSLFVVISLTRQRTREFFEAAAGPLSEG